MPKRSNLSKVRAAAGRAGAAARWAGVERKPTEKIRVYTEDADRLRAMPGTMTEALHAMMKRSRG